MSKLENRINFVMYFSVNNANPNGDPMNGNQPRQDMDGYGIVSQECIKRKIRDRLQEMGLPIFVQSDGLETDKYRSLESRYKGEIPKEVRADPEEIEKAVCEKWTDVRLFGHVFAYSGEKGGNSVSIGIRGPVTIQLVKSVESVNISYYQTTKSVNGADKTGKASDTMGGRYMVDYGIYCLRGTINPLLGERTGLQRQDVDALKEVLCNLFDNDESSARPAGSMIPLQLVWFEHNCPAGQYKSYKVFDSIQFDTEGGDIVLKDLPGLTSEIINC